MSVFSLAPLPPPCGSLSALQRNLRQEPYIVAENILDCLFDYLSGEMIHLPKTFYNMFASHLQKRQNDWLVLYRETSLFTWSPVGGC